MKSPLLLSGAFLLVGATLGYWWAIPAASTPETPEKAVSVRPSVNVLRSVQQLARLEGSRFYLERVVDLREKQSRYFGMVEAEDAILLVAAGEVTAGIDLGALTSVHLTTDEEHSRVHLRLPHAEIFSSQIDGDKTYVHTRKTELLAERQIHLETRARQVAESGFRQAALDAGILASAEQSIEKTLRTLIQGLGVREVTIDFIDAPAAAE